MVNEFDKKETEIKSAPKEDLKINVNPAVTSPFEDSFESAGNVKNAEEIEVMKADLADAATNNNIREIFDYFDIGVFINRNGTYGISEYRQPSDSITFADVGIDEEKLIENVVKISGNADFRKSSLVNFGKIQYIGGRADFRSSKFKPNMKLPKISGKIIFYEHQTLLQGIFIRLISAFMKFMGK